MMYYPMFFDPTYFLVLIGIVISMIASARVKSTFAKYDAVRNANGMTGAEAAQRILNQNGIYDVAVVHVSGTLTDHFDPASRQVRLSDTVYGRRSVAAVSVAAHECGHVLQDAQGYVPLKLRAALVPVANFGGTLSWPLIILGIFLGGSDILINIGIWMFIAVVAFHLVTLPVEFNASSRAMKVLEQSEMLAGDELAGAGKVLRAAAMTYVAALLTALAQLLRLILIFGGRRRDD